MNQKEKAKHIQKTLDALFPNPEVPLKHTSAYTLLVATLLSAQCTDERVNQITPELFALADTPEKMSALSVDEILEIIRPCGLGPKKADAIFRLSKQLIEKHQGQVPNTFEELEALPGVGHKTASCVMAHAFQLPAFAVDTHIHRLAKRWGLTQGKNVEETERDLKRLFPKKDWLRLHLQIIFYGRTYCPAKKHVIEKCPLCALFAASKAAS